MDKNQVNLWLSVNAENFAPENLPTIKSILEQMNDNEMMYLQSVSFKKPSTILLIALLIGWERFFIGSIVLGILKVMTCYGCGIWWLIDVITAKNRTKKYNFEQFQKATALASGAGALNNPNNTNNVVTDTSFISPTPAPAPSSQSVYTPSNNAMVADSDSQKWQQAIQDIQTAQNKLLPNELSAFNALVELYNSGNLGASASNDYIQTLKQHNKNRLLQKVYLPRFVDLCEQYFNQQAPFASPPPASPVSAPSSAQFVPPVVQPPAGGAIPMFTPPTQPSFTPPNTISAGASIEMIQSVTGNTKQWSSATPGYIIFLIDQSGSMKEAYETGNKATFTALVINRTINELININMDGDTVKDRVFITLIGYGGKGGNSVDELKSAILSEFANNPLRIENRKQKVSDGNGGLIEINVQNPIFIEPIAEGYTPMGKALELAKQKINNRLIQHPNYPAPVIINISDGLPYEGKNAQTSELEAINAAKAIMLLSCDDGNPLIFNAHIGDSKDICICSASESELPDNQAKFLFTISSKIPNSYKDAAKKQELNIKADSKGFVSNADPETFIKFINFGSSGGKDRVS